MDDLICVITSNDIKKVEVILSTGIDVNLLENTTPLMQAKSIEVAQLLIKAGADINILTLQNFSALHYFSAECQIDMMKLLIDSGAKVDVVNNFGLTPFLTISKNNTHKKVELQQALDLLVENGADIYRTDNSGRSAIEIALNRKNHEVVDALLKYPISQTNNIGYGPRPFLFDVSSVSYFKRFVKSGADIGATVLGETILLKTIYDNKISLTNFLIKQGVDLNVQNIAGVTPIMVAAQREQEDHVLALLNAGADILIKDYNGQTLLDKVSDKKLKSLIEKKMLEIDLDYEESDSLSL